MSARSSSRQQAATRHSVPAAQAYRSSGTHRTYLSYKSRLIRRFRPLCGSAAAYNPLQVRSAALLAAFLIPATAFAQVLTGGPWTLTSSTADNGGGLSTGGSWTVTGTIGQPDAASAASTTGAFAVTGGFWTDATVIPTENNGPQLTISRPDAASVRLGWTVDAAGWTLQRSTDLTTWADIGSIPATPGTIDVPLSQGPRFFFRLMLK